MTPELSSLLHSLEKNGCEWSQDSDRKSWSVRVPEPDLFGWMGAMPSLWEMGGDSFTVNTLPDGQWGWALNYGSRSDWALHLGIAGFLTLQLWNAPSPDLAGWIVLFCVAELCPIALSWLNCRAALSRANGRTRRNSV